MEVVQMRTLWFSTLMATAILSLAARTDAAMGRGESGSPSRSFTGNRGMVYSRGSQTGFANRNSFYSHNRFGNHGYFPYHRNSFGVFFGGGSLYYYPSYGYYPVYPYPAYNPYPVYNSYPVNSYGAYSSAPYVYDSSAGNSAYIPPQTVQVRSYLELGHDWAKDLRLDLIPWDQLVVYLKQYIVSAPPASRDEFRRGFLAGYGLHAEEAYGKAMQQAVESLAADKNAAPPATNPTQPAPATPPSGY
jgi:hypothetical protein